MIVFLIRYLLFFCGAAPYEFGKGMSTAPSCFEPSAHFVLVETQCTAHLSRKRQTFSIFVQPSRGNREIFGGLIDIHQSVVLRTPCGVAVRQLLTDHFTYHFLKF